MLNLFFCSLNKIKYIEFHHRLATNGSFHHYQTRSSKQLRTEYVRLQKFMNSFLNHGIKIWNDLPESIKNVKSLPTFKRKTKEYILNKCKLCQMKELRDDYHYLLWLYSTDSYVIPGIIYPRRLHYCPRRSQG